MTAQLIDIILGGIAYTAFIALLLKSIPSQKKKPGNDSDEGDGGINISKDPDIDLPPGVCLPLDPDSSNIYDKELIH